MLDPGSFPCSSLLQPKFSPPYRGPLKGPTAAGSCATGLGVRSRNERAILAPIGEFSPKLGTWPTYSTSSFISLFNRLVPVCRCVSGRSASRSPAVIGGGAAQTLTRTPTAPRNRCYRLDRIVSGSSCWRTARFARISYAPGSRHRDTLSTRSWRVIRRRPRKTRISGDQRCKIAATSRETLWGCHRGFPSMRLPMNPTFSRAGSYPCRSSDWPVWFSIGSSVSTTSGGDHVESDGCRIGPDGYQGDDAALVAPGGSTVHMTSDRCACGHKASELQCAPIRWRSP
jgi:hypothetical protein